VNEMTTNKYNKVGHYALGFFSAFAPVFKYLIVREVHQFPPENKAHPELFVKTATTSVARDFKTVWRQRVAGTEAYWSEVRVMDTMNDLLESATAHQLGWLFEKALWLWLGYKLAGLAG